MATLSVTHTHTAISQVSLRQDLLRDFGVAASSTLGMITLFHCCSISRSAEKQQQGQGLIVEGMAVIRLSQACLHRSRPSLARGWTLREWPGSARILTRIKPRDAPAASQRRLASGFLVFRM